MNFDELSLNPALVQELKKQGLTEPTLIQQKCIPEIKQGHDIVGQSGTGSGKTLAFGLPLLEKVKSKKGIQALILTPTRELCVQVADVLTQLAKPLGLYVTRIFGGVSMEPQVKNLQRTEIVVGTPGRILDHLNHRTINLTNVHYVVLDEADKMFEMGFIEDVEEILGYTLKERQTVLFSATIPESVNHVIKRHLRNPQFIQATLHVDKSLLRQAYYDVPLRDKFSLLVHLLKTATPGLAIIFCATRQEVNIVSYNLHKNGIDAVPIHGGLSQNRRLNAIDALRKNDVGVLVATDVAARGLDIKNVTHVYNYDVPKTSDEYIHRIGRTARAGEQGDAVTLLSERDHDNFRSVLRDRSLKIAETSLPPFPKAHFLRKGDEEQHFYHHPGQRGNYGRGHDRSERYSGGSGGYRSHGDDRGGRYESRSGGRSNAHSSYGSHAHSFGPRRHSRSLTR